MEVFKMDEYKIYEKGREYSVIVFPKIEYMWAFDNFPEENFCIVDGTAYAYKMLKLACAILIAAQDKIIYFPCKQGGIGIYYGSDNNHLVLCSPHVQLRRSRWVQIRRKIGKKTWVGKYKLQYDRKKLEDYCKKMMLEKEVPFREPSLKTDVWKKIEKTHVEEIVGDTLFMVMSKEECYYKHYCIAKDMDQYQDGKDYGPWTTLGWIITKEGIEDMKREEKKDAEKAAKKRAEFPECVYLD